MSCREGEDCREPLKRFRALIMLGLMAVIFLTLSVFSFVGDRSQALPRNFSVGQYQATAGKRVFQAYNCMGCHTIVGNGAYFGPDLTNIYEKAGPAWLAAFLPSAGRWPTEAALKVQLANPMIAKEAGVSSLEAYYDKYPGARERIRRRGGIKTLMPSLSFTQEQIYQLIAFFEYTSALDTEGWPPKVKIDGLKHRIRLAHDGKLPGALGRPGTPDDTGSAPSSSATADRTATADTAGGEENLAGKGKKLVATYGCTACHSSSDKRLVGPGWGGLYGSQVKLADGSTVTADTAYLIESIRHPGAKTRKGFPKGVMPTYGPGLISDADLEAIVAYLRSLENK